MELGIDKWRANWTVADHFVSLGGTVAARSMFEWKPSERYQTMNTMTMSCRYKVSAFVVLTAVLIAPMPHAQSQSEPAPVVSRVYWVTIHTRSLDTFDSLYGLLSRDLKLPVFFQPETHGARRYAAVLAGNVILEPCGPFADSSYRSASVLARWSTLIFRPHRSTADSLTRLEQQGIEHGSPKTETWDGKQVNVNVTGLSTPGMLVMLSECVEGEETLNAKLGSLRDELKAGEQGSLGIRCVDEIHIGYSNDEYLSRWRALLSPIQPTDGVWQLSAGPRLRLVRADRDEIVALVLKVGSIAQAVDQLTARNMLGGKQENMVAIAEGGACGLKIYLRE